MRPDVVRQHHRRAYQPNLCGGLTRLILRIPCLLLWATTIYAANGAQLAQIASLIEAGIIRPVMDRVFPFGAANEALAYIETGRSKGKVVVKLR
jgi:NADPH:quinone reductase-like Zn-dependent oxidoreductase